MRTRIWTAWPTSAVLVLAGILTQAGAAPPDLPAAEKDPVQVILEMRFLSVAESFFERIGLDFDIDLKTDRQTTPCEMRPVTQQFKPYGFINECCPRNYVTGLTPVCTGAADNECCPRNYVTGLTPVCTGAADATQVIFLNDCQVAKLLEAVQGDQRTNVLCAPKIRTLDGQEAVLNVCQEQFFVTGVDVFWNGEQVLGLPKSELYTLGLRMSAQPEVSADRSCVRLHVKANWTSLDADPVPLWPVQTMITPIFEGGARGAPVPITQFIQTPKITQLTVDKTVCIPDSGTVLLSGWTRKREQRCEDSVPILSQIPILNCLFKKDCQEPETERVLLLITSRIIKDVEEPCRLPQPCPCKEATLSAAKLTPPPPVPMPANGVRLGSWQARVRVQARQGEAEEQEHILSHKELISNGNSTPVQGKDKKVAKLLAKYQRACDEGRLADAQKLAGRALILDPACFRRGVTP